MTGWRVGVAALLGMATAGRISAQVDWTDAPASYICRSSNEVREIKTYVYDAPQGDPHSGLVCRVDYVKNGRTQTVWSSHTQRSYCAARATSLATLLGKGIFACKPLHATPVDR